MMVCNYFPCCRVHYTELIIPQFYSITSYKKISQKSERCTDVSSKQSVQTSMDSSTTSTYIVSHITHPYVAAVDISGLYLLMQGWFLPLCVHHASIIIWLNAVHPWPNAIRHQYVAQCCASGIKMAQFGSIVCIMHQYGQYCASYIKIMAESCAPWLNSVHPWLNAVHQASIWLSTVHQASSLNAHCASSI